jgi:hypothetical protein
MKKCAAFWKHTNLRNSDKIFPCCRFKQPVGVFDGNVSEILHSDVYNKLRLTDVSTLPACATKKITAKKVYVKNLMKHTTWKLLA